MKNIAFAVGEVVRKRPRMIVGEQCSDCVIPIHIVKAVVPMNVLACPVCHSTNLAWASRVEHPEFKRGAIACQHCGQMYDVTPRN